MRLTRIVMVVLAVTLVLEGAAIAWFRAEHNQTLNSAREAKEANQTVEGRLDEFQQDVETAEEELTREQEQQETLEAELTTLRSLSSQEVLLPTCGNTFYGGEIEPVEWDSGCTGSPELTDARWVTWTSAEAVAEGMTTYVTCEPNCAEGGTYTFPIRLRAFDVAPCVNESGEVGLYYTRVTGVILVPADHPSGLPQGEKDYEFELICNE